MLAKIKKPNIKHRTFKAVLYTYGENQDFWLPNNAVESVGEDFFIVKEFAIKGKGIDYEKIELKDEINVDVKPLKHLLVQNSNGYFPKALLQHQQKAFDFAKELKSVALFMEMGTGKSKLYIDLADYHYKNQEIDKVFFFAPPTTLDNFRNELNTWRSTDLNWDIKSIHFLSNDVLTHEELRKFIAGIDKKTLIIIDESHRIKSVDSKMSVASQIIGKKTDYKIIGTGTSAPNYAIDLVGQFMFLVPSLFPQSKSALKKILKVNKFGKIEGVKDNIGFLSSIYPYCFYLTKKEAIELPALHLKSISVNSNQEFKDFYSKNLSEAKTAFMSSSGTVLGFLQNLRKLATGRNKENEVEVLNPKIECLKEVLLDIPTDKKIIIWHNFHNEIEDIAKAIAGRSFDLLNGEMNEKQKIKAIDDFKNKDLDVLIATQPVGGVGLNFTEAEVNIYFSNSFNLIDRLQSMARSHRIGQEKQVTIYDLTLKGTIDERIMSSLERKEDFFTQVVEASKKNKEEVLNYV